MSTLKMLAEPFSRPRRPTPTTVEAFVSEDRAPAVFADDGQNAGPTKMTPTARLCVEVSTTTLRALKIRAAEQGTTIKLYVLALLERDGL